MPNTKKTQNDTVKMNNKKSWWVESPKELPIALPRISAERKTNPAPEWLEGAPKGAYMSPKLLVDAGFYKSEVAAQVALKKWTERGFVAHPGRGIYQVLNGASD